MRSGPSDARPCSIRDFDVVLVGARANRPEAWERLYWWLAPGVAGYLRMLGAREVDDLTNEVFLAVFRRVGDFHGTEANFRSWVFNVAHSRLIDERRRRGRRPDADSLDNVDEPSTRENETEDLALWALDAESVEVICAQLPIDQRSVVLLRIIGDLSIEQVAQILGKSPGAIKQLQRRGFESARKLVAREGVTQ
jgi:RNA polymerase sigma factor (sigma-70 family)